MKIQTFNDDLIGLKKFSIRLESFINIEHQYVDEGLVVGLSSKFGSGKSTFFQMWKSSLQQKKEEERPLVILLNAWESDYYGDPLFAIISALIEEIEKEGKSAGKIADAAKSLGWFSTAVGGQIVKKLTGIDPAAAGDLADKKKKERDNKINLLPDTFSLYENRKRAMNSLREALQEFVKGNKPKILFLVDELDRCRPDYAISYLETIKHIFDIKGTVFLLAADRKHLENSAKTAFGADLDFDEYYRKFVHREVTLPDITETGYEKIASKYVNYYLEADGSRNCFMKIDDTSIKYFIELVGSLNLTPRQIQEVFRILGHIFDTTEDKKGRLLWCIAIGSMLMAVLKLANNRIYNLLGARQLDPKEALDFFRGQVNSYDFWFELCLTGGGIKKEKDENYETIIKKVGLISETEVYNQYYLSSMQSGWGHYSSDHKFEQIFQKIEELDQWR